MCLARENRPGKTTPKQSLSVPHDNIDKEWVAASSAAWGWLNSYDI